MDRRVFEPRPNGSDGRRRSALSMAVIILAALGLWYYTLRNHTHPAPTPATPSGVSVLRPSHESGSQGK